MSPPPIHDPIAAAHGRRIRRRVLRVSLAFGLMLAPGAACSSNELILPPHHGDKARRCYPVAQVDNDAVPDQATVSIEVALRGPRDERHGRVTIDFPLARSPAGHRALREYCWTSTDLAAGLGIAVDGSWLRLRDADGAHGFGLLDLRVRVQGPTAGKAMPVVASNPYAFPEDQLAIEVKVGEGVPTFESRPFSGLAFEKPGGGAVTLDGKATTVSMSVGTPSVGVPAAKTHD